MPDEEYGVFTPYECQRIWKAVGAFERLNPSLLTPRDYIGHTPIYFRNDSGQVIPPFSIVQLTDTVDDEGKVYYLARRPIQAATALNDCFVVSGANEIAIDGYGVAQEGPIYRIKTSATYSLGTRLGPENNQWTATTGIMFSNLGDDELETGVVRAYRNESMIVAIATSGIPGRVSAVLGTASVDVQRITTVAGNRTIATASYSMTAYNLATLAVQSNALVLLSRIGPYPIVVWEECN